MLMGATWFFFLCSFWITAGSVDEVPSYLYSFLPIAAASINTLKPGEMMNSSTTLVSPKNIFTMGFFSTTDYNLSPTDSNLSYLGIWYTQENRPVWIANRETPISDNSGVLTIDPATSNLIIKHNRGSPIEIYSGVKGSNTSATLLDSGNFVLKEGDSVLWESFNNPTDTLLPGMKLGFDHRTQQKWSLTSWLAQSEPAPGAFTLEYDPKERSLVIKYRGVIYWKSGSLKEKDFEIEPQVDYGNFNYKFKNVTSKDEEYFTYTIVADHFIGNKLGRNISAWQLDYQGSLVDLAGRPNIVTSIFCYGYNTGGSIVGVKGCQLREQPECRSDHPEIEIQTGYFGLNSSEAFNDSKSLGYSDCRAICWQDCDCLGFINNGDTGCSFSRGRGNEFVYSGSSPTWNILISNSSSTNKNGKKENKWILWVAIAVVITLLVMLLSGLFYYRWRKHKREEEELQDLVTMDGYTDTTEFGNKGKNDIKFFSFASIAAATRNFSLENKLGEGGFGPVYMGEFPEGHKIAVKRLSRKSTQGLIEFKNEIILIAKLQHVNLVRLLGGCINREEKMLIYEFMPNKSLDKFLFNETMKGQLNWHRRFSIIEGIAQGLLYLHNHSRLRIIHRDLKAANILLDQNMIPKISDFGMAKIFKRNLIEANTERIVGTYGYMAPEYAMEGIFSVKSDVYSFGVLLLEIQSGRKNNSFYNVEGPLNLVAFAWELWNRDAALEFMDPTLHDSCIQNQFLRCLHVGLLCVEDNALNRPTMQNVVTMLTNETTNLPMPNRPSFYTGSHPVDRDSQKAKSNDISLNSFTITAMEAR